MQRRLSPRGRLRWPLAAATVALVASVPIAILLVRGGPSAAERMRAEALVPRSEDRTSPPAGIQTASAPRADAAAVPAAATPSVARAAAAAAREHIELVDPAEVARLRRETDRVAEALADGTLTPAAVLARIREERDPATVGALFEALQQAAETLDPETLAAWLELARWDPDPERRWWAVASLGLLPDPEGQVRAALFELVRSEPDGDIKTAALDALFERAVDDPTAAAPIARFAVERARAAGDARERAEVLAVVDLERLDAQATSEVASFLADGESEVRRAAVEVLGTSAPASRGPVLETLERAYGTESDPEVRAAAVTSIVEVGRHEGAEVLRRLRAAETDAYLASLLDDYAAVLDSGEVDLDRIEAAFAARQAARGDQVVARPLDPEDPHDH